jgi:UDP-glucuronate 4-epimerase
MFLFTDAILNDKPINVFNEGNLSRDFTYIDDIIQGVILIIENSEAHELYQLYNIGNNKPIKLLEFITEIEIVTGRHANKQMLPMQPGDVIQTWADVTDLKERFGYNPIFSVKEGVREFVSWYKEYYKLNHLDL